jgi:hypothetical protein
MPTLPAIWGRAMRPQASEGLPSRGACLAPKSRSFRRLVWSTPTLAFWRRFVR